MLSDIRISHRHYPGGWITRATIGGSFVDIPGFVRSSKARQQTADLLLHSPH